jgi:hypothetical protein
LDNNEESKLLVLGSETKRATILKHQVLIKMMLEALQTGLDVEKMQIAGVGDAVFSLRHLFSLHERKLRL